MKLIKILSAIGFTVLFYLSSFSETPGAEIKDDEINIRVFIEGTVNADSLTMFYYDNVISPAISNSIPHRTIKVVKNKESEYVFPVKDVRGPGYFTLTNRNNNLGGAPVPLLYLYLAEPGDNVYISLFKSREISTPSNPERTDKESFPDYKMQFIGNGATKYRWRYLSDLKTRELSPAPFITGNLNFHKDNTYQRNLLVQKEMLDTYRASLSPMAADILESDILCYNNLRRLKDFILAIQVMRAKNLQRNKKLLNELYSEYFEENIDKATSFQSKMVSKYYPEYVVQRKRLRAMIEYDTPVDDYTNTFRALRDNLTGELRDKISTCFFLLYGSKINDCEQLIGEALQFVHEENYQEQLRYLNYSRAAGQQAYNFSLTDLFDHKVTLESFRGKIVFLDFWFTGCGACQNYYQDIVSDLEKKYEGSDQIVFISVSIDKDKKKWIESIAGGKYTSDLATNLYTGGLGSSHPVITHYKINSYPMPIIIDKRGYIYKYNGQDLRKKDGLSRLLSEAIKKE